VPDVAANASPNSGYPLIFRGVNIIGNGTSASAPLWAGLIAVLNAAVGKNVGFINPLIYRFRERGFRDIVSPPGPNDNGFAGQAGYPVKHGWDATTGWGSPNGKHLLHHLKHAFKKDVKVHTHHHTFSKHEVAELLKHSNPAVIHNEFHIEVDGFRPDELGITQASLIGAPNVYPQITPSNPIPGVTIGSPSRLFAEDPTLYPSPQRFTWVFPITFTDTSGFKHHGKTIELTASIGAVSGYAKIHFVGKEHGEDFTGKVSSLVFDKFGDFSGFEIETKHEGHKKFKGNSGQLAHIVEKAWKEKVMVTVVAEEHDDENPQEIIFRSSA